MKLYIAGQILSLPSSFLAWDFRKKRRKKKEKVKSWKNLP